MSEFMSTEEIEEIDEEIRGDQSDREHPIKILTDFPDIISMVIYGKKGYAKSSTGYAFNEGNAVFAVLDFDGNANNVIKTVVKPEKRDNFHVYNISQYVDIIKKKNDKPTVARDAAKIHDHVVNLLLTDIAKLSPNVVIFDGFHEWEWLCRMKMKDDKNSSAFSNTPIGHWSLRSWNIDVSFAMAKTVATDIVIFTMHEIDKQFIDMRDDAQKIKDDAKGVQLPEFRPQPQWKDDVKEKIQIVVRPERNKVLGGTVDYSMFIENNKITGKEGEVNITRNPKAFWDHIFSDPIEPFI